VAQNESDKERRDRELIELLNELRVALPGVQMLFGFLLAVPFTQKFASITTVQRHVYYATFLSTAFATIFFIAPTAYHRLRFRQKDKEQMLQTSNRLAIVGTACLAAALGGAVYLVSDLLFKTAVTGIATATAAAALVWFWYGLPVLRRIQDPDDSPSDQR
jgi:amino acid transporter